jgi:hypothetical protein
MHLLVDAVDLAPQLRKRRRFGTGRIRHDTRLCIGDTASPMAPLIGVGTAESKENIDSGGARPI